MFIREALAQGGADLKYAGIKTPGLDASLLLAHVLKKTRTGLLAATTETLSEEDCEEFCSLIERRASGECAAYITGKKEFRGLEFTVNNSVLVPRPDTETLVEAALKTINPQKPDKKSRIVAQSITEEKENDQILNTLCYPEVNKIKILDLCTGSGAVAISLKHEIPELEVHASDISKEALKTAESNAERLLGKNQINFYHGDLFDALPSSQSLFSLIVSNPPYIPSDVIGTLSEEVRNEPRIALDGGKSGLEIIERIINKAPIFLQDGGTLLLEADPGQMDEIKALLINIGFKDIDLYKDLSDNQRVISGRYEE
ncbi:MAG: peptide chain release factor N(5)-glutamine methyltransferase [Treponema sp.]|jgi:release factor glutamine methyltransferase|nr:peptide chain release factor N(5)-glutamine methyltransferase [Treponema sp.]